MQNSNTGPFYTLVRLKAALFEDRSKIPVFAQTNVCPAHAPTHTLAPAHNVIHPAHYTLHTSHHHHMTQQHHASLHHIHLHRH